MPEAASPSKRIGTTLGERYKVISLVGKDETGETYLVEHSQIRKNLTLKIISPELLPNPELAARFEREMLATVPLEHPNMVVPTDLGRTGDGASYLVFEHIEGKNVRELLASGPLPPPRVLHIARQITSALSGAHSVNIVHRDLTPEKILLRQREGELDIVKVTDFGLAQIRAEALRLTQWDPSRSQAPTRHATAFGTPRYMAPEQAVGGEVDERTDLYSLGVILYELLTGSPPFTEEDPSGLLKQHIIGKVPTPTERAPGLNVPAEFERLLMRLLAKNPEERPATARAVLDAIDQITASEQQGAAPASPSELARPVGTSPANAEPAPPSKAAQSAVNASHRASRPAGEGAAAASEPDPDGTKDAAPLGGQAIVPPRAPTGAAALIRVRTHGLRLWNQALDRIRPRLPPKLRGVSQPALGLLVFGVTPLILILLLVAIWPSSETPKTRKAAASAMPGFASEREMERGVEQGAPALVALVAKYPKDGRCHRALVRAYAAKKNYVDALRALVPLLQLDPSAQSDESMSQVVAEAVFVPEISESALAFLETAMGAHGVDVLLDLAAKTPTEPWLTRFKQSLAKDSVRKLASPEALVLIDLRAATRCEQKKALLPRAGQQGGARVQTYLRGLQSTVGCGAGGKADCWPCLRRGPALQNAITAIDQRGGVAP